MTNQSQKTPSPKSKPRGRPQRISSEAILEAALEVLEEQSGELSIRRLATKLGTAPTTIYNRYGDIDGLLEAMAQHWLELMVFRLDQRPWQEQLTEWMNRVRTELKDHPGLNHLHALQLDSERLASTVEGLTKLLATAGLSKEQAIAEAQGALWHTFGHSHLEMGALASYHRDATDGIHRRLQHLGISISAEENFERVWTESLERHLLGLEAKIAKQP